MLMDIDNMLTLGNTNFVLYRTRVSNVSWILEN
jgi:hypothetical protein